MTRWPGKADHGLGLGNVNITQHGIGGGDAAGRRIGEHHDIGQVCAARSSCTATVVRGICMSDRMPSCMRAPPEATKNTKGHFLATAERMAVMMASPAAMPSEPPMKPMSWTAITMGRSSIVPKARLDGIFTAGLLARFLQAVGIFALVAELERIGGHLRARRCFSKSPPSNIDA